MAAHSLSKRDERPPQETGVHTQNVVRLDQYKCHRPGPGPGPKIPGLDLHLDLDVDLVRPSPIGRDGFVDVSSR